MACVVTHDIPVSEIFGSTIQGEGALIGSPTMFVRTGGCDFRCSWCDSLHAVLPEHRGEWTKMPPQAILDRLLELAGRPMLVTLSGGNPAIHGLEALLDLGHEQGWTFTMETQGSVVKTWFNKLDYMTLSPKPPSSGMHCNVDRLLACVHSFARYHQPHDVRVAGGLSVKVVVFDPVDYEFARMVHANTSPYGVPFFLQVGNPNPPDDSASPHFGGWDRGPNADTKLLLERWDWLAQKVLKDRWTEVRVLPQLHTLAWSNRRGV